MTPLIDELEELIDDKRERVADLLRRIREEWPRAKRLVFDKNEASVTPFGKYEYYFSLTHKAWRGRFGSGEYQLKDADVNRLIDQMQAHFNAAWQAMTEGGK